MIDIEVSGPDERPHYVEILLFFITGVIPDCKPSPSDPNSCFKLLGNSEPFSTTACDSVKGHLPRLLKAGDNWELLNLFETTKNIWVGVYPENGQ